jgi:hypothetical protein
MRALAHPLFLPFFPFAPEILSPIAAIIVCITHRFALLDIMLVGRLRRFIQNSANARPTPVNDDGLQRVVLWQKERVKLPQCH